MVPQHLGSTYYFTPHNQDSGDQGVPQQQLGATHLAMVDIARLIRDVNSATLSAIRLQPLELNAHSPATSPNDRSPVELKVSRSSISSLTLFNNSLESKSGSTL